MSALLLPASITDYAPGIHHDITAEVYHRKELGVVNCGALKKIARTPKHYRAWLAGDDSNETPALLFGRALHALVLEPDLFARSWARQPDFGDLRTKTGKERRDEWLACHPGVTTVSGEDWDRLHCMRDTVMGHPIAGRLFHGGVAESTAIWTDQQHGLLCKARMDYYVADRGLVIDLKSTEDASEAGFAKSVATYRYHVQHAHYASAFQAIGHELRAFLFVAVEKSAPFAVNVHCLDADAEARGIELRDREMALMNRCLKSDHWPGYEPTIHRLSLPAWALRD